jgi:hypothetical protein
MSDSSGSTLASLREENQENQTWQNEAANVYFTGSCLMPVISYFFGIYVRMYHNDHPPPHFHVEYQGHILQGYFPSRAARLVKDWCLEHQAELMKNWEQAQALEPLDRIPGADYD